MIGERTRLTQETRNSSADEMQKLGLIIDSLQIHEIDDPTGYIKNLALPHTAAVASAARIAQAAADREATQREQEAEALKAEARRDTEIKKAGFQADMDKAAAEAKQAGPLADAQARQAVIDQQTEAARRQADLAEQELQATVRKPADAQAYQQVTLANASRDAAIAEAQANKQRVELGAEADAQRVKLTAEAEAERVKLTATAQATATKQTGEAEAAATEAKGRAEGESVRARGLAEAEAIEARSRALAENQEAVIGQQLAEHAADIVAAAAGAFNNVDNMVVLNGAEGVVGSMATVATQAGAVINALRGSLLPGDPGPRNGNGKGNGSAPAAPPANDRSGDG
jgi:uncharacterized membrane protein YqiK